MQQNSLANSSFNVIEIFCETRRILSHTGGMDGILATPSSENGLPFLPFHQTSVVLHLPASIFSIFPSALCPRWSHKAIYSLDLIRCSQWDLLGGNVRTRAGVKRGALQSHPHCFCTTFLEVVASLCGDIPAGKPLMWLQLLGALAVLVPQV